MGTNRYSKLNNFASHSAEVVSFEQFQNQYQYSSDILGEDVDIFVVDSAIDPMHYEFTDPDTNKCRVQLVDWTKLIDDPSISYDELRSHDFSFQEMNSTIKGYFQEIIDDAVQNNGFKPQFNRSDIGNGAGSVTAGVRGWTPAHFHNVHFPNQYIEKLIRDNKLAMTNYMPGIRLPASSRFDSDHGTACASCAAGRTVGMAPKAHIYFVHVDFTDATGVSIHHLPDLFHQCKIRSGNKRPTVVSLSIGTPRSADDNLSNANVASSSPTYFTSSVSIDGVLGKITTTVPSQITEFHNMVTENRHVRYPSGSDGTGTIAYPITGSIAVERIKSSNSVLDYIEETFNLTPAKSGFYDDAIRLNQRFVVAESTGQRSGIQVNRLISSSAIIVASAGNDQMIMKHASEHSTFEQSLKNNYTNGKLINLRYRSASLVNVSPKTFSDTFIPFNGTPKAIYTTSTLQNISSSFSQSLNVNFGRFSGSVTHPEDLGLQQPYVVRIRPIFSNKTIDEDWGDGTTWRTYSNGIDFNFTSSLTRDYSCDLTEITNKDAFKDNNVSIITGSIADLTMPLYDGMVGVVDNEEGTSGLVLDSSRLSDENSIITSYQFNGAYNVLSDLASHTIPTSHKYHGSIRSQLVTAYLFGAQLEIFNGHSAPQGNFIGLLTELRDQNENLITGSIYTTRELDTNKHTITSLTPNDDQSTFSVSDQSFLGAAIQTGSIKLPFRENGISDLEVAYVSGSLDESSAFTLIPPSNIVSSHGTFNFAWEEDNPGLYDIIKNAFNLTLDRVPLSDAYLRFNLGSGKYYLLKEDPDLGQQTESSSIAVKTINSQNNLDSFYYNDNIITVGASTIVHHRDPNHNNVSGSRDNMALSELSSSKFFYRSSSYEPYDAVTNFTQRGSRTDIFAPGEDVITAATIPANMNLFTTYLDYFDTGSKYHKVPYAFASCSFQTIVDSSGNSIPQISWMTGSFLVPSAGVEHVFPVREAAYNIQRYSFVDHNERHNAYRYFNGTSFSSPYVAGICALWKELFPDINAPDMISLLQATAYNGILSNPHLTKNRFVDSFNNFDLWYYGLVRNFLTKENSFDIPDSAATSGPGQAQPHSNGRAMQGHWMRFSPGTSRDHNYGGPKPTLASPVLQDQFHTKLYQYYTSYTSRSNKFYLGDSPNLIAHWPFANTYKKDIFGDMRNIQLTGSIIFNQSGPILSSIGISTEGGSTGDGTSGGDGGVIPPGGGY